MYDVYGIMYDVSIFTEPPHPQGLEESFTQSIFYIYNIYLFIIACSWVNYVKTILGYI